MSLRTAEDFLSENSEIIEAFKKISKDSDPILRGLSKVYLYYAYPSSKSDPFKEFEPLTMQMFVAFLSSESEIAWKFILEKMYQSIWFEEPHIIRAIFKNGTAAQKIKLLRVWGSICAREGSFQDYPLKPLADQANLEFTLELFTLGLKDRSPEVQMTALMEMQGLPSFLPVYLRSLVYGVMKSSPQKDAQQGLKNWEEFYTAETLRSLRQASALPFKLSAIRADNLQATIQADLNQLRTVHEQLIQQLSHCDPALQPVAEMVLKAFAEKIALIEGFLKE